MRRVQWWACGLLMLAGCAAGGLAGAAAGDPAAVGEFAADGEFLVQSFGYSLRPPAGWAEGDSQATEDGATVIVLSPTQVSAIQVTSGPPSQELSAAHEADAEQALLDAATDFSAAAGDLFDTDTRRVVELSSGQTAVVMDIDSQQQAGGGVLITVHGDYVHALVIQLGTDVANHAQTYDAIVDSFRLID